MPSPLLPLECGCVDLNLCAFALQKGNLKHLDKHYAVITS